ncbi:hypothetical protein N9157_02010 [Saprospiraceae bacterium]|nr:hypothetical protein [Saprospiraceae bacterium]
MQPIHYRVTHAQNLIYQPLIKTYDKKNPKRNFTFLIIIALCSCIYLFTNSRKPFIKYDENGLAKLAEWRQDKLTNELDDLEQAEQYVLVAKATGYFPCFSCPTKQLIHLNKGEIWKDGFTSKGKI